LHLLIYRGATSSILARIYAYDAQPHIARVGKIHHRRIFATYLLGSISMAPDPIFTGTGQDLNLLCYIRFMWE